MNQQRNTIPHTIMSHMTFNPRLALVKNDAGELVPSMNREGVQDKQVAGTITAIEAKPISYVRAEDGKVMEAYLATADINVNGREEKKVSVICAASQIDNITVNETYWLTIRKSADGSLSNLSCGGLKAKTGLTASVFDELDYLVATTTSTAIAATA